MSVEKIIVCCLKCKRLKSQEGNWVEVDVETVQIISDRLKNGYCEKCADELYDELEIRKSVVMNSRRQPLLDKLESRS